MLPYRTHLPIALHGTATTIALVAMTLWPPASGKMLLVPLTGNEANRVANTALAGGAMLLGAGPIRGSLVVVGDRSRIMRAVGSWDILVTAAPPAGCGPVSATGAVA